MTFSRLESNILFFLLLLSFNLSAQNSRIIKGCITNFVDENPLPFVHIQIRNTGIGTISDQNGYFSLKVPSNCYKKQLLVSYIGYESYETEISKIKGTLQIKLKPADYQIGEVIVMPDSTLLTLLEKAFKKIPENYPDYPTSLTGFYREAVKKPNNEYAYFAEAVTLTYKDAYTKHNAPGQVKIIKSLVNEFPKIDSLPMRFYGGVFEANSGDIVLKRGSFINPKNFKNYRYKLEGTTRFNNAEVYIISFDTKNDSLSGGREGRFYLDKASLAYLFIEYQLTPRGLKKISNDIASNRNITKLEKKINYFKVQGKWHFMHSKSSEYFSRGKNGPWILEDEYLTTKVQTDSVEPVPLNERLEFGDIFSEKAKTYQAEDYWEEYNVLNRDSLLNNQLKLLYDTSLSKKLLTGKSRHKHSLKTNLIKILMKLSMGYSILYSELNIPGAGYTINYNNQLNTSGTLDHKTQVISDAMLIRYNLNHRWDIFYSIQKSLSKKILAKSRDLGASYRLLLTKKRKPVFLYLNASASYNKYGWNFITDQNTNFQFAGKTFDANRLQVSIGHESFGFKPGINIEYPLKRRLFLQFSGTYYLPVYKEEKLFLKEKSGFFLTRKNASLPLSNNEIVATFNGEPTNKSHFNVSNYSFGIGLVLRY